MMLPPDPPPDLPASATHGQSGDPEREKAAVSHAVQEATRMPHAGLGGRRRLALFRLLFLALSTIGVATAFVLLAMGHLTMAARVLAGDVLLVFAILIAV